MLTYLKSTVARITANTKNARIARLEAKLEEQQTMLLHMKNKLDCIDEDWMQDQIETWATAQQLNGYIDWDSAADDMDLERAVECCLENVSWSDHIDVDEWAANLDFSDWIDFDELTRLICERIEVKATPISKEVV